MKFRCLISALLLAVSLFSLPVMANDVPSYNQIVIFGDSLSDNGNLYHTSLGIIPKSPPYYQGRFSNGPAWSELVADYFADKAHVVTVNYAVGGETVNFHNPLKGFLPYTFTNSLDSYYLHTAFRDKTHSLFVIWLGANDYLKGATDPEQATADVIVTIQKNLDSLISSGGKNFLIINLPDLAAVPLTSAGTTREILHTITLLHNKKLQDMVDAAEQQHPDISIHIFDVYHVYEDLANNLPAYNEKYHTHIKNVTDPCWDGGYFKLAMMPVTEDEIRRSLEADYQRKTTMSVVDESKAPLDFSALEHYVAISPDLLESYQVSKIYASNKTACTQPDDYAFWDHIHPTAAVHTILGGIVIEQINQFYHNS